MGLDRVLKIDTGVWLGAGRVAAGISCLVKGLLGSGCFVLICVDLDLSLSVFILGERTA